MAGKPATTEPPRKRVRCSADDGPSLDSKAIIVRVGLAKQEFYVHEELLSASSEFFNNALKKEWRVGHEAAIDVVNVEPEWFKAWVKFLYTGRVFIGGGEEEGKNDSKERDTWKELYALADFIQDIDFKDALIDAMMERIIKIGKCPAHLATYVFSGSTKDSAHRKFAVDLYVLGWPRGGCVEDLEKHPPEFVMDVVRAVMPRLQEGIKRAHPAEWLDQFEACKYHDHGDKPCYKTKPAFRF